MCYLIFRANRNKKYLCICIFLFNCFTLHLRRMAYHYLKIASTNKGNDHCRSLPNVLHRCWERLKVLYLELKLSDDGLVSLADISVWFLIVLSTSRLRLGKHYFIVIFISLPPFLFPTDLTLLSISIMGRAK